MKNFGRAVRIALAYRFSFVASILCALGVGVLWGANIGSVYPFVEIALQGKSLHGWVDMKIDGAEEGAQKSFDEMVRAEERLAATKPSQRDEILRESNRAKTRLQAEREAISWYRWAKPAIVRYLPDDPFQTVAILVGLILLGTAAKSLCVIGHTVLVARLSQRTTLELRKQFFGRTLHMDLATFNHDGSADLMSRFTHDMESLGSGMVSLFGKLVREPIKMAVCLIGAGLVCWRLLLLSLVIAPVAGLLIVWLAKTLKRANRRAMEEMAQIYNNLEEVFSGIKVVKAFTMETSEQTRFQRNAEAYYKKAMRIARYDSLSHPLTEMLGMTTITLALLAGACLVMGGGTHLLGVRMSTRPLELGTLFLFYGLLIGAADPARKLSDVFTQIQRGAAAADRIFSKLDRQPAVRDPENPRPLARHHESLVFENVQFAYQAGHPVLKGIDLEIDFGETLAIVGPNGCGKSTLASLIPRFADPTDGTIRLDGIPLGDVRLHDLRSQIGLVAQETLLFDDTVANNVRYGSPDATDEQVVAAAKQAHAHRFIENDLSDGYQTSVGSLGGQLSGGQRQRIALARAILRDPAILILDEATSQIDLQSEQVIQRVLEEFIRDRTTIIVTHRLVALSLADRILVMQDGRLLDIGTHDELVARCDFYRRLHLQETA